MLKVKYLLNSIIALFLFKQEKYKKQYSNSILFGGHGGNLYQDNSKALYEYALNQELNNPVYFVSNKNTSESIPGNVLIRGSIENYIAFYNCKKTVFSHSMSSDIAPFSPLLPTYNSTFKTFISHGVEGFKKKNAVTKRFSKFKENILKGYNLQFAVGEVEKNIKINEWGISPNKIKLCGLARYDKLIKKETSSSKDILYMPTWRPWITNDNILESDYYRNIIKLITNEKLLVFLKSNNISINIYIHQLMHPYFKNINLSGISNINLLDSTTDLQNIIIQSKMLITDYSSVCWDFLYTRKPVCFYMFDKDDYNETVGSYLNLYDNELGDYTTDIHKCVDSIIRNYTKNTDTNTDNNIAKYFSNTNSHNCKTILDNIINA